MDNQFSFGSKAIFDDLPDINAIISEEPSPRATRKKTKKRRSQNKRSTRQVNQSKTSVERKPITAPKHGPSVSLSGHILTGSQYGKKDTDVTAKAPDVTRQNLCAKMLLQGYDVSDIMACTGYGSSEVKRHAGLAVLREVIKKDIKIFEDN